MTMMTMMMIIIIIIIIITIAITTIIPIFEYGNGPYVTIALYND